MLISTETTIFPWFVMFSSWYVHVFLTVVENKSTSNGKQSLKINLWLWNNLSNLKIHSLCVNKKHCDDLEMQGVISYSRAHKVESFSMIAF